MPPGPALIQAAAIFARLDLKNKNNNGEIFCI